LVGSGDAEPDLGAAIVRVPCANPASVLFGDVTDDREAEAGAGLRTRIV
jgi:hypothetical protein